MNRKQRGKLLVWVICALMAQEGSTVRRGPVLVPKIKSGPVQQNLVLGARGMRGHGRRGIVAPKGNNTPVTIQAKRIDKVQGKDFAQNFAQKILPNTYSKNTLKEPLKLVNPSTGTGTKTNGVASNAVLDGQKRAEEHRNNRNKIAAKKNENPSTLGKIDKDGKPVVAVKGKGIAVKPTLGKDKKPVAAAKGIAVKPTLGKDKKPVAAAKGVAVKPILGKDKKPVAAKGVAVKPILGKDKKPVAKTNVGTATPTVKTLDKNSKPIVETKSTLGKDGKLVAVAPKLDKDGKPIIAIAAETPMSWSDWAGTLPAKAKNLWNAGKDKVLAEIKNGPSLLTWTNALNLATVVYLGWKFWDANPLYWYERLSHEKECDAPPPFTKQCSPLYEYNLLYTKECDAPLPFTKQCSPLYNLLYKKGNYIPFMDNYIPFPFLDLDIGLHMSTWTPIVAAATFGVLNSDTFNFATNLYQWKADVPKKLNISRIPSFLKPRVESLFQNPEVWAGLLGFGLGERWTGNGNTALLLGAATAAVTSWVHNKIPLKTSEISEAKEAAQYAKEDYALSLEENEEIIKESENTIKESENTIKESEKIITAQGRTIKAQDGAIKAQDRIITVQDKIIKNPKTSQLEKDQATLRKEEATRTKEEATRTKEEATQTKKQETLRNKAALEAIKTAKDTKDKTEKSIEEEKEKARSNLFASLDNRLNTAAGWIATAATAPIQFLGKTLTLPRWLGGLVGPTLSLSTGLGLAFLSSNVPAFSAPLAGASLWILSPLLKKWGLGNPMMMVGLAGLGYTFGWLQPLSLYYYDPTDEISSYWSGAVLGGAMMAINTQLPRISWYQESDNSYTKACNAKKQISNTTCRAGLGALIGASVGWLTGSDLLYGALTGTIWSGLLGYANKNETLESILTPAVVGLAYKSPMAACATIGIEKLYHWCFDKNEMDGKILDSIAKLKASMGALPAADNAIKSEIQDYLEYVDQNTKLLQKIAEFNELSNIILENMKSIKILTIREQKEQKDSKSLYDFSTVTSVDIVKTLKDIEELKKSIPSLRKEVASKKRDWQSVLTKLQEAAKKPSATAALKTLETDWVKNNLNFQESKALAHTFQTKITKENDKIMSEIKAKQDALNFNDIKTQSDIKPSIASKLDPLKKSINEFLKKFYDTYLKTLENQLNYEIWIKNEYRTKVTSQKEMAGRIVGLCKSNLPAAGFPDLWQNPDGKLPPGGKIAYDLHGSQKIKESWIKAVGEDNEYPLIWDEYLKFLAFTNYEHDVSKGIQKAFWQGDGFENWLAKNSSEKTEDLKQDAKTGKIKTIEGLDNGKEGEVFKHYQPILNASAHLKILQDSVMPIRKILQAIAFEEKKYDDLFSKGKMKISPQILNISSAVPKYLADSKNLASYKDILAFLDDKAALQKLVEFPNLQKDAEVILRNAEDVFDELKDEENAINGVREIRARKKLLEDIALDLKGST